MGVPPKKRVSPIGLLRLRFRISVCSLLLFVISASARADVLVSPSQIRLGRPEASQQVLVTELSAAGQSFDRTRQADFEIADPSIATVSETGLVHPVQDGQTELVARFDRSTIRVPIEVVGVDDPQPVSFRHEIMPILTKAGCNAGGCHGKAGGQNGFKLSVFGYDPDMDYDSMVRDGGARRVFTPSPDQSLLLRKASAAVPHGGGQAITPGTNRHRLLRRWIAEGALRDVGPQSTVVRIEVEPQAVSLRPQSTQQVRVTAIDANGSRFCVTSESRFDSNAATIAGIDSNGLIAAGDIPGEAAMVVSYQGHVDVCRVTLPREGVEFPRPPEHNFIDSHAWDKLVLLGIPPSELATDAMFLRRVFLDTIGTLPTIDEARAFLDDATPDKRARLIDALLERPEYADFWALWWADILRVDQGVAQPQGAVAMTRWLRKQIAINRPYDEFVRDILTARGDATAIGPASFYRVVKEPDELSRSVSQLFLGVRIECAQCHHHPSERWGQADYYAFAGFFTGLKQKQLPTGATSIIPVPGTDATHPLTGQTVATAALGEPPADFSGSRDRRIVLADWMTSDSNPYFAKVIVNRIWAHYFGRGLVEPIDDLRATNPASNEPLMAALEEHLRDVDYDLKELTRTLLNSRLYQLSSDANAANTDDLQNFSHALIKPLRAEVLLDAINQAAGTTEKFEGWPDGYRAIQVWDNRMPSYFFRIFGRPLRASVCQCERGDEPSIAQALHLMNSPEVTQKIQSRSGRARLIANSGLSHREMVESLYLATLSRFPTGGEQQVFEAAFQNASDDPQSAVEDIIWTLLNMKEFLYSH